VRGHKQRDNQEGPMKAGGGEEKKEKEEIEKKI
jgi:hypothetical protein